MGGAGDPTVTKMWFWVLSSWKSHSRKGRPILSDSLEGSGLAWGKLRAGEVPDPAGRGVR